MQGDRKRFRMLPYVTIKELLMPQHIGQGMLQIHDFVFWTSIYHTCLVDFSRLLISPLVAMDVRRGSIQFPNKKGEGLVKINNYFMWKFVPLNFFIFNKVCEYCERYGGVWEPFPGQIWIKLLQFRPKIHHLTPKKLSLGGGGAGKIKS